MSRAAHLAELEKRQALETEILEARAHPSDANHGTAHMERVVVAAAP